MIMGCFIEELCRTTGVRFEKVLEIAWGDGFGYLGLGASTQKIGENVDFSMGELVCYTANCRSCKKPWL